MCQNADNGCNCHHPCHMGRRCGRPHGGPNGRGKCDFCRGGHIAVASTQSTEKVTAAIEIVSCVHAKMGQTCAHPVFKTRGAEKEACGDTGYVIINNVVYCKSDADLLFPDWPNHLEV